MRDHLIKITQNKQAVVVQNGLNWLWMRFSGRLVKNDVNILVSDEEKIS
jgi:hypothetical protein